MKLAHIISAVVLVVAANVANAGLVCTYTSETVDSPATGKHYDYTKEVAGKQFAINFNGKDMTLSDGNGFKEAKFTREETFKNPQGQAMLSYHYFDNRVYNSTNNTYGTRDRVLVKNTVSGNINYVEKLVGGNGVTVMLVASCQ